MTLKLSEGAGAALRALHLVESATTLIELLTHLCRPEASRDQYIGEDELTNELVQSRFTRLVRVRTDHDVLTVLMNRSGMGDLRCDVAGELIRSIRFVAAPERRFGVAEDATAQVVSAARAAPRAGRFAPGSLVLTTLALRDVANVAAWSNGHLPANRRSVPLSPGPTLRVMNAETVIISRKAGHFGVEFDTPGLGPVRVVVDRARRTVTAFVPLGT